MHCPNCGTQFSNEQKFCRTCGLGLQAIVQLTTQMLTENTGTSPAPQSTISDRRTRSQWTAWITFLGLFVFLCGLMLFALNHILNIDRILDLPAAFACLLGTFVALYGALFPRLHAPKWMPPLPSAAELPATPITNDLSFLPETRSERSVVEHTTRHLEPILHETAERRDQ